MITPSSIWLASYTDTKNMFETMTKYIVDIEALKNCLELTPQCKVNGDPYVSLAIIKEMIDRFPKDEVKDPRIACR